MVASYACAAHQHFPPTGPHESALTEMTDARAGECYSVSVLVDLRAVIIFTDLARFRKGRWEMASLEEHWSAKQVFVALWFVERVLVVLVAGLLVHPQDIDILAHQNLTCLSVFLHSVTVSDAQHNSKNTGTRSNSPSPGRDGGHHFGSFWYLFLCSSSPVHQAVGGL